MAKGCAYLAEDKVYLKAGDAPAKLIESAFAQGVIDREQRDRQRNEWKTQGGSPAFQRGAMPWAAGQADVTARRIQMTALTCGGDAELLYALNTSTVGGLFLHTLNDGFERRIFHRNGLRVRSLSRAADGTLVLSMEMEDGTANLATIDGNGRGLREVTEGDSVDEAPTWMPGQRRRIVFQSAGAGRNQQGHLVAVGPYAIQQLDLDDGQVTTLVEDSHCDYLCPKPAADGSLYYIRRPYSTGSTVSPVKLAGDILLFPFRLARAIVHFCNVFAMIFGGKPLLTAGAPGKPVDQKYLMLWGKYIDAKKTLKSAKAGHAPSLVPPDWELLRRSPDGKETVLAKGVLSFDIHGENQLIFTNGTAVFELGADGTPHKLCEGSMIQHVVAIA